MRGCDVLWGHEEAVEVRRILITAGVAGCPCSTSDEECQGCPIMGDWRQGERLRRGEPAT